MNFFLSLRAEALSIAKEQRSNLTISKAVQDCFVADAPRNDIEI
ncbi:MAG: hypothetical protein WBC61_01210 [Dehalococcoidia bacterium]